MSTVYSIVTDVHLVITLIMNQLSYKKDSSVLVTIGLQKHPFYFCYFSFSIDLETPCNRVFWTVTYSQSQLSLSTETTDRFCFGPSPVKT